VRGSCPQRVAGGSQPTCRRVIGWRARSAKQIAGGLSASRAKRETNLRALWAARGPGNRRRVAETKTKNKYCLRKVAFQVSCRQGLGCESREARFFLRLLSGARSGVRCGLVAGQDLQAGCLRVARSANFFCGSCLGRFVGGSRAGRIAGGSRAGRGRVAGGSCAGCGHVAGGSRAGREQDEQQEQQQQFVCRIQPPVITPRKKNKPLGAPHSDLFNFAYTFILTNKYEIYD